ncbi:MAG: ATP-binding protein [Myxococcaceae bacterium]
MILTLVGVITLTAVVAARAPGWKEMRPFMWVAVFAFLYCAGDAALTFGISDAASIIVGRLQLLAAGFHIASWFRFNAAMEKRPLQQAEKVIGVTLVVGGLIMQVPGLGILNVAHHHQVAFFGSTVVDEVPSALGQVIYALMLAGIGYLVAHFVQLSRRGVDYARTMGAMLGLFLLTALNDALASSGVLPLPYLSGAGLMFQVIGVGYILTRRFLSYASSLHVLSAQLERSVEARDEMLNEANQALGRAEKLAAVGQLAAGVAHEINNPAAVIKGNLTFLKEELTGKVDQEIADCLDDSIVAVGRIARIVRELLSAGRVAGRAEAKLEPFNLGESIDAALTLAAPAVTGNVAVADRSDRSLVAIGQSDLVAQVVANLVTNAAQAISGSGAAGTVTVTTERRGETALVSVEDDGPGIPEALQKRVFEPFFTTKEIGKGTGLGLAVSIGLMQAQGGSLVLKHSKKGATRFELTLPFAAQLEKPSATGETASKIRGLRLLLVDDEASVLAALKRTLKARHQVTTAGGVKEALALVEKGETFDALLCDVAMPDGGGEGLYATLNQSHPQLARRTFFITGGALEPRSREFIEQHRDRVLLKPFDSQQLFRLLEVLEPPAPIPMPAAPALTVRAG